MTNQLTAQQIAWAQQHDWFSRIQDGLIVVVDRWVNMNTGERGEDEIVWNKSFRALRDWAGY